MKELWQLYLAFAKLGALTFGGGYAMLPILQREIVEKRKWATEEEIANYYAIGQCTPGVISVNTSTFIGQKKKGVAGGIAATVGFITPSILIITLIAAFIQNFADYAVVKHAFAGIRVCVCVLIFDAVRKLLKKSVVDRFTACLFAAILLMATFTDISPILYVVVAGALGIAVKQVGGEKE